jgi:hypothetical protein
MMSTEPNCGQPKRNDTRTTQELIRLALTEPDESAAWEAVTVLHRGHTCIDVLNRKRG